MQIEHFIVGSVQTNCYFIIQDRTKELIVVDPGASGGRLAELAKQKGYEPVVILLTHGHFDHCEGIEDFREAFPDRDIEVIVHEEEKRVLEDPELNLSDSLGSGSETYHADRFVKDHEKLSIAGFDIEVLLTPGHTPGGCCYYFPGEKAVFCGDTLFAGSVGRTDFPEGSMRQLIRSVKEQLFVLPEDTRVFPGHEGTTTIGDEKRYNFFVQ